LMKSDSTEGQNAAKNGKRTSILAILFAVEGVLYVAFSILRTFIAPLNISNVPPDMGAAIYAFLALMLLVGAYFVYRAYTLLRLRTSISNVRLSASLYTLPIWILPAFSALQTASSLLANPESEGLQQDGFHLLKVGLFFVTIGIANLSSIMLLILQKWRRR